MPKRSREKTAVNTELVEIFEDLSNLDTDVRIKATSRLYKIFTESQGHENGAGQITHILTRLFRGLNSGRKAARIGFSVALTEVLRSLRPQDVSKSTTGEMAKNVLEMYTTETSVPGDAVGQEGRGYALGSLFAAKVLLEWSLWFTEPAPIVTWQLFLESMLTKAKLSVWLRQEYGFILWNFIRLDAPKTRGSQHMALLVSSLEQEGLLATPEGVAIWLAIRSKYPHLVLPSGHWTEANPLHRSERGRLARILKEASIPDTTGHSGEGDRSKKKDLQTGFWNANLHFAWESILKRFYQTHESKDSPQQKEEDKSQIGFVEFWQECVDESLFASASSDERKYWGFLLAQSVLINAPVDLLTAIFTPNLTRCFTNQLSMTNRFLHLAAEKTRRSILNRANRDPDAAFVLLSILASLCGGRFDKVTKTKTLEGPLIHCAANADPVATVNLFECLIASPTVTDINSATTERKAIIDQISGAFGSMTPADLKSDHIQQYSRLILLMFVRFGYSSRHKTISGDPIRPELTTDIQEFFKTRLHRSLASLISKSSLAPRVATEIALLLSDPDASISWKLKTDDAIRKSLTDAHKWLKAIDRRRERLHKDEVGNEMLDGSELLMSLAILQIHDGEAESVSILEDLLLVYRDDAKKGRSKEAAHEPGHLPTLIEIILSAAARQSLFFRKFSKLIFSSLTNALNSDALDLLLNVLEIDESASGQAIAFEEAEAPMNDVDNIDTDDDSEASDVEDLSTSSDDSSNCDEASDVDVVMKDKMTNKESETDTDSSLEASDDEESKIFNAKLALALGTRHLEPKQLHESGVNKEMSDISSDSDMDDADMEKLDSHLTAIFRERKKQSTQKQDQRSAKENIVNFKCRVLELLEIFVKQESRQPLTLNVLIPVLQLVRTSNSALVSRKASNLIHDYNRHSKGTNSVLIEEVAPILTLLHQVHAEVGKDSANAFTGACSNASLLLVRILAGADREHLRKVVSIYAATQERLLFDAKAHLKVSFFSDWLNWCGSLQ